MDSGVPRVSEQSMTKPKQPHTYNMYAMIDTDGMHNIPAGRYTRAM